jgi:hypothetical protein
MGELWEYLVILVSIIVSSKSITVVNKISFSEYLDGLTDLKLFCIEEILGICLTGLIKGELERQFLPTEGHREWVSTRVGWINLPDLNSVICKEEVYNKVEVFRSCEKLQYFTVVLKKLFFGDYSASTKFFFKIVFHDCILNRYELGGRLMIPCVLLIVFGRSLRLT